MSSKFQKRHNKKALNKYSDNITDLTVEQLMERLNLETTYFYSENGIEVLNAPVRTFGNYKRAILSLTKNNSTNSYILTYPEPDNSKIFYVSNLDGTLIQKVDIGDDGIGISEEFQTAFENHSKLSQNYAMRSGNCYESIYITCSGGNHSFANGTYMNCIYWTEQGGTPPQMYQIPGTCNSGGGGDNPGGFDNGGFGTPPTGGGGSPSSGSPQNCIVVLDCVDCNLPPDLDNDCDITVEEMQLYAFFLNLTDMQRTAFTGLSQNNKTDIFNYLVANAFGQEAKDFAIVALDPLNDGAEVDFANKIIKDPTFIGTKADCVLNALISSNNNLFKKTSQAFTNQNSKFKIKFTAVNDATDIADARTSLPDDNGIIEIRINLANVANSNALNLAKIIFHETIHAELHRIKLSNNAGPNPLPQDQYNWYADMWERYEGFYNGNQNDTASAAEHYYMSVYFIDNIAKGLRQFDNNTHPLANYKYFAWEGLENYGTQNGYITSAELSALANLTTIVHNDGHTNPCD